MGNLAVSASDVEEAASRIADDVVRTRSALSLTLSKITGASVVVKFENEQFTGSFKDRGAANRLRLMQPAERDVGVVAMSAGNHAQGVAYHGQKLNIPATIVMPTTAPFTKVNQTAALGAMVVQEGHTLAETAAAAQRLVDETGAIWVHPYDDPGVIAGQGTVAVEMTADHNDLDALVVPTGGGGLLAGVATYCRHRAPDLEVIGVQSEAYPGMIAALEGQALPAHSQNTLADGIAVKHPGSLTVPIIRELGLEVLAVSEETIERSVAMFLEVEKTVAEGAGAASLAALLDYPDRFAGKRVGLILSGGNIDTRVLASVLMRELVHTGRISTLRISLPDLPGQLAPVMTAIADAGANVLEIDHRRLFDPISARATNVEVVLETRDADHSRHVVETLQAQGHQVDEEPW
ncbi:MAG: threonine ammonia-lyase [Acidimicrobiales bacterium]